VGSTLKRKRVDDEDESPSKRRRRKNDIAPPPESPPTKGPFCEYGSITKYTEDTNHCIFRYCKSNTRA
jgi:hypothetical protein